MTLTAIFVQLRFDLWLWNDLYGLLLLVTALGLALRFVLYDGRRRHGPMRTRYHRRHDHHLSATAQLREIVHELPSARVRL